MANITRLLKGDTDNIFIQLFRYAFVGGAAFVVDYGTLWVCTEYLGIHYQFSAALGFVFGLIVNYLISIKWVFTTNAASRSSSLTFRSFEFIGYAIIGLIGLGLNAAILWICTERLGVYYMGSKLISTALVFFWNFIARRIFMNIPMRRFQQE